MKGGKRRYVAPGNVAAVGLGDTVYLLGVEGKAQQSCFPFVVKDVSAGTAVAAAAASSAPTASSPVTAGAAAGADDVLPSATNDTEGDAGMDAPDSPDDATRSLVDSGSAAGPPTALPVDGSAAAGDGPAHTTRSRVLPGAVSHDDRLAAEEALLRLQPSITVKATQALDGYNALVRQDSVRLKRGRDMSVPPQHGPFPIGSICFRVFVAQVRGRAVSGGG